ncbi:MAG: hypothetical protein JXA82_07920 [Sedimentisphaerales bacterium]|nr:hypothetical protein [Sedimentisphaerales bacterium]
MERYRDPCNGQINLNKTAFKNDGPPWITKLHYPFPFKRMEAQQGFFTIAGRLDTNHAELIGDLLQGDETGKYIIPKENKQEILKRLRIMGVLAQSLDYPGADLVGSELAEQLKTKN